MAGNERRCDNCGEAGATFAFMDTDFTPTDRGTEIRDYKIYLCDECFANSRKVMCTL